MGSRRCTLRPWAGRAALVAALLLLAAASRARAGMRVQDAEHEFDGHGPQGTADLMAGTTFTARCSTRVARGCACGGQPSPPRRITDPWHGCSPAGPRHQTGVPTPAAASCGRSRRAPRCPSRSRRRRRPSRRRSSLARWPRCCPSLRCQSLCQHRRAHPQRPAACRSPAFLPKQPASRRRQAPQSAFRPNRWQQQEPPTHPSRCRQAAHLLRCFSGTARRRRGPPRPRPAPWPPPRPLLWPRA